MPFGSVAGSSTLKYSWKWMNLGSLTFRCSPTSWRNSSAASCNVSMLVTFSGGG
jgi:hypothetical protein